MEAFYFGPSDRPLYGVIHPPAESIYRDTAVLMLHPIGHEYLRSYRMVRALAQTLSRHGYYVMRFDYSGCGDSAGSFEDLDLDSLAEDVNCAGDELKAISGVESLVGVGIRLGAHLLLESAPNIGLRQAICWDPVFNGAEYLASLEALAAQLPASLHWFSKPRDPQILHNNEILGYVYGNRLLASLPKIVPPNPRKPDYPNMHFLLTESDPRLQSFCDAVIQHGGNAQLQLFCDLRSDMGAWNDITKLDLSITTSGINKHIETLLRD